MARAPRLSTVRRTPAAQAKTTRVRAARGLLSARRPRPHASQPPLERRRPPRRWSIRSRESKGPWTQGPGGHAPPSASARSGGRGAGSGDTLDQFELKADVDGRGRMCEGANRDAVRACRCEIRHALERTPPEISVCASPPTCSTASRICSRSVVEKNGVHAGIERFSHLGEALRFDLYGHVGPAFSSARRCDPACQPDMVVLDQHGVEEAVRWLLAEPARTA